MSETHNCLEKKYILRIEFEILLTRISDEEESRIGE